MGNAERQAIAAAGKMQGLSYEEMRDAEIRKIAAKIAAATRMLILTGHVKTLHDFTNAVGDRLSEQGVCEQLVRTALATGPITTGQMFTDMLEKCITDDAKEEAIKEVKRMEADRSTSAAEARAGRMQHDRAMATA